MFPSPPCHMYSGYCSPSSTKADTLCIHPYGTNRPVYVRIYRRGMSLGVKPHVLLFSNEKKIRLPDDTSIHMCVCVCICICVFVCVFCYYLEERILDKILYEVDSDIPR
jgi:hypothetical protein